MVQDPGLPDEGKIQIAAEGTLPQESFPSTRTARRCKLSAPPRRESRQMAKFFPSRTESARDRSAPVRKTTYRPDGSHRKTHILRFPWEFHILPTPVALWLPWRIFQ